MDLRLLITAACFSVASAKWLTTYACDGAGGYTIINPTNLNTAAASGCETSEFQDDSYEILDLTGCIDPIVNIEMYYAHPLFPSIRGGKDAGTYWASCDPTIYKTLSEVTAEATVVDLTLEAGFSQDFIDSDPQVEAKLKSSHGVEGYIRFSVGYPLILEFIGPADTLMKAKTCVAISGQDGSETQKTLIENGCSMDKNLLFDFTQQNYTDGAGVQPCLSTQMYAFRYSGSVQTSFQCEIQLCPIGSTDCDQTCE